MKLPIIGLLITAGLLFGQPTITYTPRVIETGHSFFVVWWQTSAIATGRLEWATQAEWDVNPGVYTDFAVLPKGTSGPSGAFNDEHFLMATGLSPNTTYHWRVQSITSTTASCNESTNCVYSSDSTVTTSATPAIDPVPPIAPDISWSLPGSTNHPNGIDAVPAAANGTEWDGTASGSGRTVTINSSCIHPTSGLHLSELLTSGRLGSISGGDTDHMVFNIDPAAVCIAPGATVTTGAFHFPARGSHTGWVVFKSSATQLPPDGVRITNEYLSYMPQFRDAMHWVKAASNQTLASSTMATCYAGQYYWRTSPTSPAPSILQLYECIDGTNGAQTVQDVTAYDSGNMDFTIVGHGYQTGEVLEFENTGGLTVNAASPGTTLSANVSSNNFASEVTVIDADTVRLAPGTNMTGSFNAGTTVRRQGNYRSIDSQGKLSSGASLPGTCTEGHWFHKTDESPITSAAYLCTNENQWTKYYVAAVSPTSVGNASPLITVAATASRYRFVGLNLTRQPGIQHPDDSHSYLAEENYMPSLIGIRGEPTDIVFDRVIINGMGYPQRTRYGFDQFESTRGAIINSRIEHFNEWSAGSWAREGHGINMVIRGGTGGVIIQNNYIDADGFDIFLNVSGSASLQHNDVLIRRNTLTSQLSRLYQGAQSDGRKYSNRHHIEIKQGSRVRIIGNRMGPNFSGGQSANSGNVIMLSPAPFSPQSPTEVLAFTSASGNTVNLTTAVTGLTVGTGSVTNYRAGWIEQAPNIYVKMACAVACPHDGQVLKVASMNAAGTVITLDGAGGLGASGSGTLTMINVPHGLEDIDITFNTFNGLPTGVGGYGNNVFNNGPWPNIQSKRIRIAHNIFKDIDFRSTANGGYVNGGTNFDGSTNKAKVFGFAMGPVDVDVSSNIVDGIVSSSQPDITGMGNENDNGIAMSDSAIDGNIIINDPGTMNSFYVGGTLGESAVDIIFDNERIVRNVLCCGLTTNLVTGISYPTDTSSLGLFSRSQQNYRRNGQSLYRHAGPNMDEIEVEQGTVKNAQMRRVTSNSAIVSYYAPDSFACTVEYGTSATWGTGTRVSDGGGSRLRNVSLSGLSSATAYNVRVLCAVDQPVLSFTTQ